jgi:bifunctional aspartokinase / homoserine dehydrogenase 1
VEPLEELEIPIRIFNIDARETSLSPLSLISRKAAPGEYPAKSVTCSDDFAILRISGPGVGIKPGILANVTTSLDSRSINIKSVVTSQTAINLYLESADLRRAGQLVEELKIRTITRIKEIDDMAIVALVGTGMVHEPGIADRMMKALAKDGIQTQIVSIGASEAAAYVVVKQSDKKTAVRAIHKEFFETP